MGPLSLSSFVFEIEPNKSLQLSPMVRLWFENGLSADRSDGSAFLIRRRN
jgi:hypothetical protein